MANGTSLLSTEIGAAAVSAYAIQLAQKWSKLPWITEHTSQINFYARLLTSGVAALGVSWVWGDVAGGGHSLVISIPPAIVILHGLWHWFVQYAVQHGWGNLLSQPITAKTEGTTDSTSSGIRNNP
jgi:hypothetical protein